MWDRLENGADVEGPFLSSGMNFQGHASFFPPKTQKKGPERKKRDGRQGKVRKERGRRQSDVAQMQPFDLNASAEDFLQQDASKRPIGTNEEVQGACDTEELPEPAKSSRINETPKTTSVERETNALRTEGEQADMNISKEKTVKKPDKILACPRCNSLDTKFCYFNNYNVNQPRHFCKNCQRYWTAGGTMRNVPVGAGRRKNKNSASQYRQIALSEALQTAQTNMPETIHHVPLKPNGTVLSFGSDAPLCDSMASVFNLAEKTVINSHRNGYHRTEEQGIPVSCGGENGEEHSSASSITATNSTEDRNQANIQEPMKRNCQSFPNQLPCFPLAPWTFPWNSAQWSSPVAPPAFCPSSLPMPFYIAPAYWSTIPGAWSIPWISPPPPPKSASSCSSPNSPTLGKHTREGNTLRQSDLEKEDTLKQSNSEQCIWIPKTLRIDDPDEAAKSSIWATLGTKNDKANGIGGGGLFKPFKSKLDDKKHTVEACQVLHANPAALFRSLNFQESL